MKRISVIAKPTHDCNLRCKYCYIEDSAESGKMSESLLAQSIEKVSDFAESSHWIWHGGEPLMMGLDFYKLVHDIQKFYKKKGKKFSNGIQTNATLVTNDLLDFVDETRDFDLGMSLDGPKEIHNRTRIYENGKGSFSNVLKGINMIKERRNGSAGVICVVSSKNINDPKELYDFFKKEHIHVKLNPLIPAGNAIKNEVDLGITPRQYGNFLLKLWKIYNDDVAKGGKLTIDIDPFMDVLGNIGTGKPLGCNYSNSCRENFISIGPQGDIYPCGRFDGVSEFWMGNVKTNTIEEAVKSEINQKLQGRNLENVASCKKCDFGDICNSGCMHNAYCDGDVLGKDPYCVSYLPLFKELKKVFEFEMNKVKGGQK